MYGKFQAQFVASPKSFSKQNFDTIGTITVQKLAAAERTETPPRSEYAKCQLSTL